MCIYIYIYILNIYIYIYITGPALDRCSGLLCREGRTCGAEGSGRKGAGGMAWEDSSQP